MYMIRIKPQGSMNIDEQCIGPFVNLNSALDYLETLPVALVCEHRFVDEIKEQFDPIAFAYNYRNNED